jgi:hypothetical protein
MSLIFGYDRAMEYSGDRMPDRMKTIVERMADLQREAESRFPGEPVRSRSFCVKDNPEDRAMVQMMMDEGLEEMEREHPPDSDELLKFRRMVEDFRAGRDKDYPRMG